MVILPEGSDVPEIAEPTIRHAGRGRPEAQPPGVRARFEGRFVIRAVTGPGRDPRRRPAPRRRPRARQRAGAGSRPFTFDGVTVDRDETVRRSIARIAPSPFIPHTHSVRGLVPEVETERLREVAA